MEGRSKRSADRGSEVRIGGPEQKLGSRPKQGVRRLGDAVVEKCIAILYHMRCPRCAAVEPDIALRSEAHALNKRQEEGVRIIL